MMEQNEVKHFTIAAEVIREQLMYKASDIDAFLIDKNEKMRKQQKDLDDTRQALAASEAREQGLRKALESVVVHLEDCRDHARNKSYLQVHIDHAKAALAQTPIESTKGGK